MKEKTQNNELIQAGIFAIASTKINENAAPLLSLQKICSGNNNRFLLCPITTGNCCTRLLDSLAYKFVVSLESYVF